VGVIDTGDLVFVKKVDAEKEIIPYFEGIDEDHRTYNSFGDVIIFRPNGKEDRTAIIHRSVIFIEFNETDWDPENGSFGGFDIPHTGEKNLKGTYLIEGYEWPEGTEEHGLHISFDEILRNFDIYNEEPHGGFITKGDDNPGVDQTSDFYSNDPPWIKPVKPEWVIGKSVGELPWFGIIKLRLEGNDNWPDNSGRNLIIAIIVLVATPFLLDITIHLIARAFKEEDEPPKEEEERPKRVRRPPERSLRADVRRPEKVRRPPPRFKP
jgi:signal peptidase